MAGNRAVEEIVPKLRKNVVDVVIENKNNAGFSVGLDRPPQDSEYQQDAPLNNGIAGTGTVDITTGRKSRDPNYDVDKSRIYVSSKTRGDTNFGLTKEDGFLEETDTAIEENEEGQAYIIAKSDSIRIIAREDVRIQNQNNDASITMKSNGDVIIHTSGNVKIGSEQAEDALVLGNQFLSFASELLDALKKHKHPTSHGPSGVAFNISDFISLQSSPINDKAIVSDFVYTQKENGAE